MPRKILTIIGIFLILIQISDVPSSWKTIFGVLVGIVLVIIAMRGSKMIKMDSESGSQLGQNDFSDSNLKENVISHNAEETETKN